MESQSVPQSYLYEYEPLPMPDKNSMAFRLLVLLPAKSISEPLEWLLNTINYTLTAEGLFMGETIDFETLSYTWGDGTAVSEIQLPNNSFLPISSNLESFLGHRREAQDPVTLWVDAVCINQTDLVEKSAQVSHMALIYGFSTRLSIWLGPASDDSDLAMEYIKSMGYNTTAFEKLSFVERKVEEAIGNLMGRSWWERIWIIQEVCCGTMGSKLPTALVRCGAKQVKWMTLVVTCARMELNEDMSRQHSRGVENALVLDAISIRPFSQSSNSPTEHLTDVLQIVERHRHFHATNPRDKLYTMFNIASVQHGIPPVLEINCEESTDKVYTDYAVVSMVQTQSLDVLRYCGDSHAGTGLPGKKYTFVPDWSSTRRSFALPATMPQKKKHVPWWNVFEKPSDETIRYSGRPDHRLQAATELVKSRYKVRKGCIPERFFDLMPPDVALSVRESFEQFVASPNTVFIT